MILTIIRVLFLVFICIYFVVYNWPLLIIIIYLFCCLIHQVEDIFGDSTNYLLQGDGDGGEIEDKRLVSALHPLLHPQHPHLAHLLPLPLPGLTHIYHGGFLTSPTLKWAFSRENEEDEAEEDDEENEQLPKKSSPYKLLAKKKKESSEEEENPISITSFDERS